MKRQLNSEDEAMLMKLRERILTTLEFIGNVEEFPMGEWIRQQVNAMTEERNLRVMRQMARDIDKLTVALPQDAREGLEAILRERLGIDKDIERAELSRQASAALKRGTVASEKERRRLEEYAEMLEAIGGDPAEIEAVWRLIQSG